MINPEKRARLAWHCRRGMLELDLLLQNFFNNHLDSLTEEQVHAFESLLTCDDPDLYAWLMGYEDPKQHELIEIVQIIRHSH